MKSTINEDHEYDSNLWCNNLNIDNSELHDSTYLNNNSIILFLNPKDASDHNDKSISEDDTKSKS